MDKEIEKAVEQLEENGEIRRGILKQLQEIINAI